MTFVSEGDLYSNRAFFRPKWAPCLIPMMLHIFCIACYCWPHMDSRCPAFVSEKRSMEFEWSSVHLTPTAMAGGHWSTICLTVSFRLSCLNNFLLIAKVTRNVQRSSVKRQRCKTSHFHIFFTPSTFAQWFAGWVNGFQKVMVQDRHPFVFAWAKILW